MTVIEGHGRQVISTVGAGQVVQALHPGDITLIRPHDQHALASTSPSGVQFYNIAFSTTIWRTFADLAGLDPSWETASTPPHMHLNPTDDRLRRASQLALDRFHDAPTIFDLVQFWATVVPHLAPPAASPRQPPGTPDWLIAASAAMRREEHLREGVPRLLALAHVSPAHLSRSVRRFYGTTPTALVAELRLRHAETLLATTTQSIADIAHRCGFANPSYFTRRFREAHHVSPREFRHRAQHALVP